METMKLFGKKCVYSLAKFVCVKNTKNNCCFRLYSRQHHLHHRRHRHLIRYSIDKIVHSKQTQLHKIHKQLCTKS